MLYIYFNILFLFFFTNYIIWVDSKQKVACVYSYHISPESGDLTTTESKLLKAFKKQVIRHSFYTYWPPCSNPWIF